MAIPAWLLPPAAIAVRVARAVVGNAVPADENQVRMMGARIYADISKARQDLALPNTPFRNTVQRTYNWYNLNGYLERRVS
jgi:hypothetical protein